MGKRVVIGIVTAASLWLSAGSASAQHHGGGDWTPKSMGFRIGGELDIWPTSDIGTTIGVDFQGQFALLRVLMLDVEVPTLFATEVRGSGQFVFGNPTVGLHWSDLVTNDIALFAGGTFSFPTMLADPSSNRVAEAAALGLESRALYDSHRFAPRYVVISPRFGMEWRIIPVLFFRTDITPGIFVRVVRAGEPTEVVIDQGNEIEWRARFGFGVGGRLQETFFLRNVPDQAQIAFEPFIGYEPPHSGFFFRLGLLTALDTPLGFGADRDKVATVRLKMGGKF